MATPRWRAAARGLAVAGVLVLALGIAACGWQLRGAEGGISLDGRVIQVVDNAGSADLRRAVRRGIEQAGGRYTEDPDEADWVLTLHGRGTERETGAVGAGGDAEDYRLTYRVDYSLGEPVGEELLGRQSIEAERRFAEPEGGADARRAREEQLEDELRMDAVRLLMLRLQTVR